MKKFACIFVCFALVLPVFGQSMQGKSAGYEDLVKQAKRKKTTAVIMLSAGSTMALGGLVTMIVGAGNSYYHSGNKNDNNTLLIAGAVTSATGIGLALGSIPVFVKSHRLRKEARLVFGTRKLLLPLPVKQSAAISQMQVRLTIPLGR